MSAVLPGSLLLVMLLVLLVLRVQIGVAMFASGALAYAWLAGWEPLLAYLKNAPFARLANYDLAVVPLFLLMGQFASHGGLSRALFGAGSAFLGHRRGGLAMAGIASCAGFGAICGSSLATAATMSHVALPELRRHRYSPALATGALAAGGTLGVLIPPSVPLVLYAILAEQNIGRLFVAAFFPGLLAACGYLVVVAIISRVHLQAAPPRAVAASWNRRWQALGRTWPVLFIFVLVIGGIYGGLFTPAEAAAVGALATALAAWRNGGLNWQSLQHSLLGCAQTTGMIFLILLGADLLNAALALSQLPAWLAGWAAGSGLAPLSVLLLIVLIYLALGCVMDSLSMLLLTVPIFLPIVLGLDLHGLGMDDKSLWFGILALVAMEIGLITPPVGMNVFIIHGEARDIPLTTIFRGVMPFLLWDLLRLGLLVAFPVLSLFALRYPFWG